MSAPIQRSLATRLGLAGALLGVAAGLTQMAVGARIPEWSGAKQAPVALGLLTVAMSLIAGLAAVRQRETDLSLGARAACALGLVGPGLLCLTTVGRLWYLPSLLLVPAGLLTVESWRRTATVLASDWARILLSALGACELLMAASATPALMVVASLGGLAVIAAAWLRHQRRAVTWGLILLGTGPFAALGWTAIVPLIVMIEAVGVAALLARKAAA